MTLRRAIPLLACLLLTIAQADERRQSGTDTERHGARAAPAQRSDAPRLRRQSVRPWADDRTLLEDIDPAVRHYWSNKCVQQRARGWGHTGDCAHPAYSGSYGTVPLVVPYAQPGSGGPARGYPSEPRSRAYPREAEPRRRAGHLGIQAPRPEGRGHLR